MPQDFEQAVAWYRKAAAQGHDGSQANLGVLYQRGQGVRKDLTQAAIWYGKAAEQGNEIAHKNLEALRAASGASTSRAASQRAPAPAPAPRKESLFATFRRILNSL